jgi:tRNA dimethylallyltransferase
MHTICLLGPTGVGKTESAEKIARHIGGEIINMDVGQMYTKIGIGTAKPEWRTHAIPHHLFDIINEPVDYSVSCFRKEVVNKIHDIHANGKSAIIVGGSLFYLQSLLFAFHENKSIHPPTTFADKNISWQALHAIDPQRAEEIHPGDTYRIQRALMIWYATGKKPSLQKPFWSPVAKKMNLLWLFREKNDLRDRIATRLESMIRIGWYEEVSGLQDTWKNFVSKKKLCGYNIVVDACKQNKIQLDCYDKEKIKKETIAYAKKQQVFWVGLKKKCAPYLEKDDMRIEEFNLTFHSIDLYLEQIRTSKGCTYER